MTELGIIITLFVIACFFGAVSVYWFQQYTEATKKLKTMQELAQAHFDAWSDLVEGDAPTEVVARYEAKRKAILGW